MYRFRITDGATHAEEFSADSFPRFRREIVDAFQRFRSQRPDTAPLRLHAWDGEWWVDVRTRRMRPVSLTERAVFADAGRIWDDAARTAWGALRIDASMTALRAFVTTSPSERRRQFKIVGRCHEQ